MPQPSQHEIKQELVDAIRMLEHAEYIDHNGHCSVRRDANSFYINSGASMRACLTVEDIVAVDLDGKPVDGGNVKPPLEFPIHAEVYRARPKVNAVFHTHPQWSTYLTMTGHPQKVVYAQASLLGDMPVMNSPMSVNTREMGEKMVAVMGDNPGGDAEGARRGRGRRERAGMLRLCRLRRGERAAAIHGDADRRAVRVQRRGAGRLPAEAAHAEPVQEDLGPLPVEDSA